MAHRSTASVLCRLRHDSPSLVTPIQPSGGHDSAYSTPQLASLATDVSFSRSRYRQLALAQDTRHLQQVHRLAAVVLTAAADAPIHADPDCVGSAQGHQHARRQIYDETERTIAKEWAPAPIGECPRNTAGTAYEPEGDAAEPVREDD